MQVGYFLGLDAWNGGREVSGIPSLRLADINDDPSYGDDARIDTVGRHVSVEDPYVIEERTGSDAEGRRHDEWALSRCRGGEQKAA